MLKYVPAHGLCLLFAKNMHHFFQEPVKKKGRTITPEMAKEETSNFLIKPKMKKQVIAKKENQAEKSRFESFFFSFFFTFHPKVTKITQWTHLWPHIFHRRLFLMFYLRLISDQKHQWHIEMLSVTPRSHLQVKLQATASTLFSSWTNRSCSQFSRAALRNTAGDQAAEELPLQISPSSHQHHKDETSTET